MKRLAYINVLMIALALFSCKKDEGLSDADHKSKFIKAMGTAAEGVDLKQTSDGGYILLGTAQGSGGTDIYLKKVDGFGNHQWSKTYDGPLGGSQESAAAIEIKDDGGYIVLGTTTAEVSRVVAGIQNPVTQTVQSSYLLDLDFQGNVIKSSTYNSGIQILGVDTSANTVIVDVENETGNGLTKTPLGNYLISSEKDIIILGSGTFKVGYARVIDPSSFSVIRLDSADLTLTSGNENNVVFVDAAFTASNQAVITGSIDQPQDAATGISALLSVYIEGSGFTKNLAFGGSGEDEGQVIRSSASGDMIIAGYYSEGATKQAYVLSFNDVNLPTPTPNWSFINTASVSNEVFDFVEVSDGFILAGYQEVDQNRQFYVLKINLDGSTKMWEKDYGFTGFDEAKAIVATDDNGLAVLGTSSDERGNRVMTLLKLDASGNLR